MTTENLKNKLENVKAELDEIRLELIEIDAEEDEWEGTPQHHIDYLKECEAELVEEYNEIWAKLDALKTA